MEHFRPAAALARALQLPMPKQEQIITRQNEPMRCAFCGVVLQGVGVRHEPSNGFFDQRLMSDPNSPWTCQPCAAVQTRNALQGAISTGLVTESGFRKLGLHETWLTALCDPPNEPFAIAVHNAKQQHVWWHTPANYNRDRFTIQYGFESLEVDRPVMMSLANKVLSYEAKRRLEKNASSFMVMRPNSKNLKSAGDNGFTVAFLCSQDPDAADLKSALYSAGFGTLWAMQKVLSACRAFKAATVEEALITARQKLAEPKPER